MGKTFFDIFPTPKFIDLPKVGLSLSDDGLYFIELETTKGKTSLKGYGSEKISSEAISGGEIKNPDEIIKIISNFKKKHGLNFVKATLPEEKAFLFRATLPNLSDDEMKEALFFKIEENVPISANDAIFDFCIVSENKESKTVVVTVMPKDTVYQYLNVYEKAGLHPFLFEVESQSVSRSVIKKDSKETSLVVNVGGEKIGLYLISNGLVHFSSTLNFGKSFFDSPSSIDKAEKVGSRETPENGVKVYKLDNSKMDVFKEEIEKLMSYWDSLDTEGETKKPVSKIIGCGDGVLSKNFSEYFSSNFTIPMEIGNVWTNIFSLEENVPDLKFEDSLNYAAAVGLANSSEHKQSKI